MSVSPERIRRRLVRVFTTMFPEKAPDDVPAATMENTENWDSLATLSLFTLTESELNIKLGLDLIGQIKSFSALEQLVSEKIG